MADGHSVAMITRTLLFSIIQPFGTLWFIYMLPVFFVVTKLFRSAPWHLFAFAILLQILPINTRAIWIKVIGLCGVIGIDDYSVLVDEFRSFFVYFLADYLFAPKLFALAEYAERYASGALGLLTTWFMTNLAFVYFGWAALPLVQGNRLTGYWRMTVSMQVSCDAADRRFCGRLILPAARRNRFNAG